MEYVKCSYQDGKVSHVLKGNPDDVDVVTFEHGKSTYSLPYDNCINATFFTWQKGDGKYFSVSPLVVNGKAHRWKSHDLKNKQWCFVFWKDGTVTMEKLLCVSEINLEKVKHVIGGVGLVNKFDKDFKYDPKGEGFGTDILRNCEKTVLAYRNGEVFLMAFEDIYHSSSTTFDLLDACKQHDFDMAISLDGGGSTAFKSGGEYKIRGDGRKVANVITIKGENTTKPVTPTNKKINVVILDAGHSTTTSGKETHVFTDTNKRMKEREFNDGTVKKIIDMLKGYKCEVHYVSNVDIPEVSLKERVGKANKIYDDVCARHGKDNVNCIFVSVHANSDGGNTWSQANGIETFVYPNSDKSLANMVQKNLIKETGLRDRGVKESAFYVLKHTKMSAILTENGFMSNLNEATLLRSDEFRSKCTKATVGGIVEYMKLEKAAEDKPVEPPKEDNKLYRVCVGSYSDKANADKMCSELVSKGYKPFIAVYEK